MPAIARDIPLAEITLRKYERPSPEMTRRDLIRKLCLSIGLLQPGDSRDVIVDVFQALLDNKELTSEAIVEKAIELRKNASLAMNGIAASNIRRQVKRLRDAYLIEKAGNAYRIAENEELSRIFHEKIEKFYLPSIVERVKEYFEAIR